MLLVRLLPLSVVLMFGAFSFGCSPLRHDFVYVPEAVKGLGGTDLRIAVLPLAEARAEVDSGSENLAYIPGVPTSANTADAPQSAQDRYRAVFYFPDLIPYGLAQDLVFNRAGSVVHFNPPFFEDYDLVIKGELLELSRTKRMLTYGLGPAGPATVMIGLPQASRSVTNRVRYKVIVPGGKVLMDKVYEDSWVHTSWTGDERSMPLMEGINQTIRRNNTALLEAIAPLLRELDTPDTRTRRQFRFYTALDPDFIKLDQRQMLTTSTGGVNSLEAVNLGRNLNRRRRWLDKYRGIERGLIEKQQKHIFEREAQRVALINHLQAEQRQIEWRQEDMDAARRQAQYRAVAGAVAGGLMAAQSAATASSYQWGAAQTAGALQDMSVSMAAAPGIDTEPPPDLSPFLRELNSVDFSDLESAGGSPFDGLHGRSVAEVRHRFIERYRMLTARERDL